MAARLLPQRDIKKNHGISSFLLAGGQNRRRARTARFLRESSSTLVVDLIWKRRAKLG